MIVAFLPPKAENFRPAKCHVTSVTCHNPPPNRNPRWNEKVKKSAKLRFVHFFQKKFVEKCKSVYFCAVVSNNACPKKQNRL